jgi:hypothetical protein
MNRIVIDDRAYALIQVDSDKAVKLNIQKEQVNIPVVQILGKRYAVDTDNPTECDHVMFYNNANGYEGLNPYATLVMFDRPLNLQAAKVQENEQLGAGRTGGKLAVLLSDLTNKFGFTCTILWHGRKDQIGQKSDVVFAEYTLISGNY